MALEKIERLGQQMQFGSDDERIWAIIELGNLTDKDEQDEAFSYLVWEASHETADDAKLWAHISLTKFVTNESLRRAVPAWFESARDTLLRFLLYYAQHPEDMTPVGLRETEMVKALAGFKGDKVVVEGLTQVVQSSVETEGHRTLSQLLIARCFRGIGAIGEESGREVLKYWSDQGSVAAKAASEMFGATWEDIEAREGQMGAPPIEGQAIMEDVYRLSESDPDKALHTLGEIYSKSPTLQQNPLFHYSVATAYGTKGFWQLWRQKQTLDIDILVADEPTLRGELGLTDEHLDYLEKAMLALKAMEDAEPGRLAKFKGTDRQVQIDAMAIALERCRPGRVQELLGKTKLIYFGFERIKRLRHQVDEALVNPFLYIFFDFHTIVRAALILEHGRDAKGRAYLHCSLFSRTFDVLAPGDTLGKVGIEGSIYIFDDGTCGYFLEQIGKPETTQEGIGKQVTQQPQLVLTQPKSKEPILAAILSLLFGGMGQIYIGQTSKGILLIAVIGGAILLSCCLGFVLLSLSQRGATWLGLLCCGIPWFVDTIMAIGSSIDAYILAQRVNKGESLQAWDWFGTSRTKNRGGQ